MQDRSVIKDEQITCGSYDKIFSCKHARPEIGFGLTGDSAWAGDAAQLTSGENLQITLNKNHKTFYIKRTIF